MFRMYCRLSHGRRWGWRRRVKARTRYALSSLHSVLTMILPGTQVATAYTLSLSPNVSFLWVGSHPTPSSGSLPQRGAVWEQQVLSVCEGSRLQSIWLQRDVLGCSDALIMLNNTDGCLTLFSRHHFGSGHLCSYGKFFLCQSSPPPVWSSNMK